MEPPPYFPLSRSIDATTWKHSTWQLSPAGHGHGPVQPFAEARLSATKADEETKISWQVSNERNSDEYYPRG